MFRIQIISCFIYMGKYSRQKGENSIEGINTFKSNNKVDHFQFWCVFFSCESWERCGNYKPCCNFWWGKACPSLNGFFITVLMFSFAAFKGSPLWCFQRPILLNFGLFFKVRPLSILLIRSFFLLAPDSFKFSNSRLTTLFYWRLCRETPHETHRWGWGSLGKGTSSVI